MAGAILWSSFKGHIVCLHLQFKHGAVQYGTAWYVSGRCCKWLTGLCSSFSLHVICFSVLQGEIRELLFFLSCYVVTCASTAGFRGKVSAVTA